METYISKININNRLNEGCNIVLGFSKNDKTFVRNGILFYSYINPNSIIIFDVPSIQLNSCKLKLKVLKKRKLDIIYEMLSCFDNSILFINIDEKETI